jgi:hypothetical protein
MSQLMVILWRSVCPARIGDELADGGDFASLAMLNPSGGPDCGSTHVA